MDFGRKVIVKCFTFESRLRSDGVLSLVLEFRFGCGTPLSDDELFEDF